MTPAATRRVGRTSQPRRPRRWANPIIVVYRRACGSACESVNRRTLDAQLKPMVTLRWNKPGDNSFTSNVPVPTNQLPALKTDGSTLRMAARGIMVPNAGLNFGVMMVHGGRTDEFVGKSHPEGNMYTRVVSQGSMFLDAPRAKNTSSLANGARAPIEEVVLSSPMAAST